ncbi:hypothetical protein BaRGS_00025845 [Batillaria attramentaria]|uniref:ASD2 domain-containing protein n=1 Tax=Batillaria attramentaria TaxID=370345 RepID=A0ABD0K6C1_9CAEN
MIGLLSQLSTLNCIRIILLQRGERVPKKEKSLQLIDRHDLDCLLKSTLAILAFDTSIELRWGRTVPKILCWRCFLVYSRPSPPTSGGLPLAIRSYSQRDLWHFTSQRRQGGLCCGTRFYSTTPSLNKLFSQQALVCSVFADDSYGAYKNRSNRQVGTYKRSASAAIIRPDNNNVKAATDANAVFTDRKLGSHKHWNSETQLLPGARQDLPHSRDIHQNGSAGTPPERPPERPGNVPAFKVDSRPVHGVTKVTGGPQPLQSRRSPQGPSPSNSRTNVSEGGTYSARPYNAESVHHSRERSDEGQKANSMHSARPYKVEPVHHSRERSDQGQKANSTHSARPYSVEPVHHSRERSSEELKGNSSSAPAAQQQPRSVKERISNLERKSSFTSPSSTPVTSSPSHTSNSQRWANAVPFEDTHRGGGENMKPRSNSEWVPNTQTTVLPDSQSARERERPPTGTGDSSAHVSSRPRSQSERVKQYDVSPSSSETQRDQRYAEVPPLPPDPRRSVRNSSHGSSDSYSSRTVPSPYNRRESAPAPQISTDSIAVVSPRRQSEGNFLSSHQEADKERSPEPGAITISHGRQPSQEELECDQKALELAKEVAGSEKKLSDVLREDATKKRMKYMDGLFPNAVEVEVRPSSSVRRSGQSPVSGRSTGGQVQRDQSQTQEDSTENHKNSLPREYFVSTPKAVLEMEWRKDTTSKDFTKNIQDNEALIKQKEELVEKLYKKMDLLKEERRELQQEINDNDALGKQVFDTVEAKCQSTSERDKFRTYIDDLEKIVRLLLNLSGQLARAENAVQGLAENADPKLKKMTLDKRERLQVKHAEAKQLKEDIDKRSDNVTAFLRQSLTADELKDYSLFVKMKSKLMIDLQELEDRITLGQEQIQELKKSIPEHTVPPADVSSVSSSSPPASPVPSS